MTPSIDVGSVPRDPRCEFSSAWWSVLHATRGAPEGFEPSRPARSQRRDADSESLVNGASASQNNEPVASL